MCSTNLGFSGGSANRYCCRTLRQYDTRYVLCTRYVCTWYQPATQIRTYLVSAGRRTFRPWTHTSDDSYIYQLSLVVATATVSYHPQFICAPLLRSYVITHQCTTIPIVSLACEIKLNEIIIDQPSTQPICIFVLVILFT